MGIAMGAGWDGDAAGAGSPHRRYSREEEELVAARLRALGYLE
jgi:hypothetical protein